MVVQIPLYVDAADRAPNSAASTLRRSAVRAGTQEMFAAVRQITGSGDVVAFSSARALTLFTDRMSVQVARTGSYPTWPMVRRPRTESET